MRSHRRRNLGYESLEGRLVLSMGHFAGAISSPAVMREGAGVFLQGSGRGRFSQSPPRIPDVGVTDLLAGAAHLKKIGPVQLTGSLTGTGFISQGHAGGTITLQNARGSVTLNVTGPPQPGFQPPSSGKYAFVITSGSGAYRGADGSGTADLTLRSDTFAIAFHRSVTRV